MKRGAVPASHRLRQWRLEGGQPPPASRARGSGVVRRADVWIRNADEHRPQPSEL
jgi:hypothetical protein